MTAMKISLCKTTPRMTRLQPADSPLRCAWCKNPMDAGLKHFKLVGKELQGYFQRNSILLHQDCATELVKCKPFNVTLRASFRSAHRKTH